MRPHTEVVADLIDVLEAARLHGLNAETVRRWIRSGRLTATRQGRRWLVSRSDVDALARSGARDWSLRTWAELAIESRETSRSAQRQTAADLLISDRRDRSDTAPDHARP